jgi:hypothetical protein
MSNILKCEINPVINLLVSARLLSCIIMIVIIVVIFFYLDYFYLLEINVPNSNIN